VDAAWGAVADHVDMLVGGCEGPHDIRLGLVDHLPPVGKDERFVGDVRSLLAVGVADGGAVAGPLALFGRCLGGAYQFHRIALLHGAQVQPDVTVPHAGDRNLVLLRAAGQGQQENNYGNTS